MQNTISLRAIFGLMTLVAVCIAVFRNLGSDAITMAVGGLLGLMLVTFSLYAIMFIICYPANKLISSVSTKTEPLESPFATDRLPTQIVPVDDKKVDA